MENNKTSDKLNIIFMGTPDFSAVVLDILTRTHKVSAVVAGLDKESGRGKTVRLSPLKQKAIDLGIDILQYKSVSKEGIEVIKALKPDLIITAAFGQILSDEFLAIPKYGVLNVHASLLPRHRGASPIQGALLAGDSVTGVTIMKTVKEVDAGDILLSLSYDIENEDNAGILFDKLALLGGEAITKAVDMVCEMQFDTKYVPQDHTLATHTKMLKKTDGMIDFGQTYDTIKCHLRAVSPWPSAYTTVDGHILKVFDIEQIDPCCTSCTDIILGNLKDGEVVRSDSKNGLIVKNKDGLVRLNEVQIEGGKRLKDTQFLNGKKVQISSILPN